MAKKTETKKTAQKSAAKTSIHTHSHEGERHIFLGIIQLVLVLGFIAASLVISTMLQTNKKPLAERAAEDRVLFAETELISPAPFRIAFKTTGVVGARSNISVVPQVSGKVIAVNDKFFEGGQFGADEILFEIEPLDFELEIRRLESSVAQARTAFNLEEAESEAAEAEWRQINGDKPVPYLVARKPQKAEAWANLKAAKAQLENAKLDLDRAKFSLPFAGRVLSANLEVGQVISAGQSYGSVYDHNNLEVQTSFKDDQLNWLLQSDNPEIMIKYEHLGETKTVLGNIKRGVSSLNNQTRFANVSIGFQEIPDDILPGIFVEIDIKGPTLEKALAIPSTAMQKGQIIWKVDDASAIHPLNADIVFVSNTHVIARAQNGAVNGAVQIVTSKMPGAIEGMTIKTEVGGSGNE